MPESSDVSSFADELISALDGSIANLRGDATTTLFLKDHRHELGVNADLINRLVREHGLSAEGDRPVFEVVESTKTDGSKEKWLLVSHRSVYEPVKILIWPPLSRPPNPALVDKAINCLKAWSNDRRIQLERDLMTQIEKGQRPTSRDELRDWAERVLQVIRDRMQAKGLSAIAVDRLIHTTARMAYEYALDICPPEICRQLQIPDPAVALTCGEVRIRLGTLLDWCNKSHRLDITVDEIESFAKVKLVSPIDVLDLFENDSFLPIPEQHIKDALHAIVGEAFKACDWAGEEEDIYSTYISVSGARVPTAMLLKGPGNRKAQRGGLTVANCNVNGDQVQRLFQSPADLFIIQYVGPIQLGLVKYARDKVEHKRNRGERATVCFINGQDTARILKAYDRLPDDLKGR